MCVVLQPRVLSTKIDITGLVQLVIFVNVLFLAKCHRKQTCKFYFWPPNAPKSFFFFQTFIFRDRIKTKNIQKLVPVEGPSFRLFRWNGEATWSLFLHNFFADGLERHILEVRYSGIYCLQSELELRNVGFKARTGKSPQKRPGVGTKTNK